MAFYVQIEYFFILYIGFIIFKMFVLSSRYQCKIRFWKIRTWARAIGQKVFDFDLPNQTSNFWHIFYHYFGYGTKFSKPIFALKLYALVEHFEYNEAYKGNKKYLTYNGQNQTKKANLGCLNLLRLSSKARCWLQATPTIFTLSWYLCINGKIICFYSFSTKSFFVQP